MTKGTRTSIRWPLFLPLLALMASASGTAFALHSVDTHHRVSHSHRPLHRIRRILWNPLFRPSHDSLLLQNQEVDRLQLPRIYDDAQLQQLKDSGDLVPIVPRESLKIG